MCIVKIRHFFMIMFKKNVLPAHKECLSTTKLILVLAQTHKFLQMANALVQHRLLFIVLIKSVFFATFLAILITPAYSVKIVS